MTHPAVTVTVTAEYRTDTDLVAVADPRLSWASATDATEWTQKSADIRLLDGDRTIEEQTVDGRDSVLVTWPFARLVPRQSVSVQVRTTGTDGFTSEWSEPLAITAGFLAEGEWTTAFIGAPETEPAAPAYLRARFTPRGNVAKAYLYATAHGVYQAAINGTDVDDEVLKPGWTAYQFRLIHETTDVTELLLDGENVISVRLAGGWYTEEFGFAGHARRFYGDVPAVAAQLHVEYDDGTSEVIMTGPDWKATTEGPLRASSIYHGEAHDATMDLGDWDRPGYDDSQWTGARVDAMGDVVPEARYSPAVRRVQEVSAVEILITPAGKTVVDFGQNLVGRIRLRVEGERGTEVTLKHAEVLEHGELGIRPLRAARATDTYVLAGTGIETWEPEFTFHGFRYLEVTGWPGELRPGDVVAQVIHSDMVRTGWFDSSHELVNQLHENVVWGMRGNFLSLPTDCPQRDERLGWTGDIQVFSPTASFLYQTDGFLASWLRDLEEEQLAANGIVPVVVPAPLDVFDTPAAAWGDAATIVPHVLHARFGDRRVLERQYGSMKKWADALVEAADNDTLLWEGQFQFGDWLDPDAPADYPADAKTDVDIVATAHFFRSVKLVAAAAGELGRPDDAAHYGELAENIRQAFLDSYVSPSGRMVSDATTGYSMAIAYDIVTDPAQRRRMGDRLAYLVRASGYHISTGFVGTPIIQDALTVTGHTAAAERLLTQTENPSWLYPVTMGATTVWERWDSMLEDGTINPGEMTSFNHYAFGAVADWLHRVVAGLAPGGNGYREIIIAPLPLTTFDHASATLETAYGRSRAGWRRESDGTITVEATIPPNTTAEVRLPDGSAGRQVGSGTHSWTVTPQIVATSRPGKLSWDTDLATIVDDADGYAALIAAVEAVDMDKSRELRRRTKWIPRRTLSDALLMTSPTVKDRVVAAFDAVNSARSVN
jgi:alpha-L-rhamnosidase